MSNSNQERRNRARAKRAGLRVQKVGTSSFAQYDGDYSTKYMVWVPAPEAGDVPRPVGHTVAREDEEFESILFTLDELERYLKELA